ncbi:MAG: DUF364 domain-containing protein, partial [Oscillospiraceae bacterium]|nr:DUF364 domain-containing protein [Oscillospiraceae bacterium]
MNYCELYKELIQDISPDAIAERIICGASFCIVMSGGSAGICRTQEENSRPLMIQRKYNGMPLKTLAESVMSWNFQEACIGAAAINAWYNAPKQLRVIGMEIPEGLRCEDRTSDPFITLQREVKGKNVVSVGHFPYIDKLFAPYCNLTIIEKHYPEDGDYPEQASEFLLPLCDYAFISGYTLAQKSLPRMLELTRNAYTILINNSVPLAPVLHRYGVNALAGFVIKDTELAERIALG